MKSFFALVLAACEGHFRRMTWTHPLIVLATADEETSMAGARALAAAGGLERRGYAIIGEPTEFRPVRLHKGILMERIRVEGRSGHSGDPELRASVPSKGMH